MEFKDKVKAVRKKLLITQEQLANEIGCTRQTINRWENGKKLPSLIVESKFDKFCEKKNINFKELNK
jgi:DNA-binding XRE family transcriptional regulator